MGGTVSETIPEKIGKYPVEALVAKGGMGAVYKATHPELKRPVIIKKLTIRGNPSIVERFTREARILLELNHPHIVRLFDYFQDSGSRYLVLEYVDGMSLDRLLRRKERFSGPMALLVFLETCAALKYAHDRGVIHRDVKPGNILISRKGSIKLADFGIAADSQESGGEDNALQAAAGGKAEADGSKAASGLSRRAAPGAELTVAGSMLGTPSYMPPEQFVDSSTVDLRADVYSAGVMLYEIVTGKKPFPGGNSPATREAIRRGKYVPIRKLAPETPPIVARIVKKAMHPNPKRRYRDLGPVIKAVTRFLRRYPVKDIRFAMVKNMLTSSVKEPAFRPARRIVLRAAVALSGILACATGFLFAWEQGYVHRYVLRAWYAPVEVSIPLPALVTDSVFGSGDLQFQAFFFRDDGDTIPEVAGTRRILETVTDGKTPGAPIARCRTVWLRPGSYRLKLVAGPRIWWESFRLGSSGRELELGFGALPARTLSVKAAAFDASSGVELTQSARFYTFLNGVWTPLSSIDAGVLRTGTIHRFRVERPGYKSAEWSLLIGWHQDELVLKAGLESQ